MGWSYSGLCLDRNFFDKQRQCWAVSGDEAIPSFVPDTQNVAKLSPCWLTLIFDHRVSLFSGPPPCLLDCETSGYSQTCDVAPPVSSILFPRFLNFWTIWTLLMSETKNPKLHAQYDYNFVEIKYRCTERREWTKWKFW